MKIEDAGRNLISTLINSMNDYDDYDPELIAKMTDDWNKIMAKVMEAENESGRQNEEDNNERIDK